MTHHFLPAVTPAAEDVEPPVTTLWIVFAQDRLLVNQPPGHLSFPTWETFSESGLVPLRQHYLGQFDYSHCYAVEIESPVSLPQGMTWKGLREFMGELTDELFALAGRASQILQWDQHHQFCGRCGERMHTCPQERCKQCPRCGLINYPRLTPAVIMRITRGHEILLSRSPHFKPGRYSVQAGFVEVGETLEEAVKREIREEVGLEIQNLRYFGSQPWPFPSSLMLAFTAEYASGDLKVNYSELEDARWCTADNLPSLPPHTTIARQMIDSFLQI